MIEQPINNISQLQNINFPTDDVTSDINNNNSSNNTNKFSDTLQNDPLIYKNKYNDKLILTENSDNSLPASLQIATHNIRSTLGHLSTQVAITSYMSPLNNDKSRLDILGFAHTGLTVKQSKHVFTYSQFKDFKPYFAASDNPSYQFSGVGFLVRSNFAKYIKQTGHWKGRVIYIDFFLKGKTRLRII